MPWLTAVQEASDDEEEVEVDPGQPKLRRGTAAWYHRMREEPIYPGNAFTVLTVCYWISCMKTMFRVPNTVIDLWCKFVHILLLPQGNMFPPSFYLVKAVLGVPELKSVERHVCPLCWTLYPDVGPDKLDGHANDKCTTPGCSGVRCIHDLTGKPIPTRKAYYFGESKTVRSLLREPGFLDQLKDAQKRARADPASFWRTPAGRSLDKACGYKFTKPRNDEIAVLFSFGGDGGQMFDNKQYGTLVWGLRLLDLPPELSHANNSWAPLGLVQGPNEPTRMEGLLEPLVKFFARHDPGALVVYHTCLRPASGMQTLHPAHTVPDQAGLL